MKHIITQNQVCVETEIHSVISTPVCHSSMGGPSSLEISRQLMFHPQGLPAVFIQAYKKIHNIMNNIKYSLYLCSRKKEVPP
jgi:hypothetical protein